MVLQPAPGGFECCAATVRGPSVSVLFGGADPPQFGGCDYQEAKRVALEYQGISARDNYFIEIRDHGIPEQKRILPDLIRPPGRPASAWWPPTTPITSAKRTARCEGAGLYPDQPHGGRGFRYGVPHQEFYIKSRQEMEQLPPEIPEALDNTWLIVERCNVEFEFRPYQGSPTIHCARWPGQCGAF